MNRRLVLFLCTLVLCFTCANLLVAMAAPATDQLKEKRRIASYHRVEFLVVGTDCPICLGRIASKIKKVSGVKKASVWQFAPTHYGVVIYDAQRAQWNEIVQSVADEKVTFEGVKDLVISQEEARQFLDAEKDLKQ